MVAAATAASVAKAVAAVRARSAARSRDRNDRRRPLAGPFPGARGGRGRRRWNRRQRRWWLRRNVRRHLAHGPRKRDASDRFDVAHGEQLRPRSRWRRGPWRWNGGRRTVPREERSMSSFVDRRALFAVALVATCALAGCYQKRECSPEICNYADDDCDVSLRRGLPRRGRHLLFARRLRRVRRQVLGGASRPRPRPGAWSTWPSIPRTARSSRVPRERIALRKASAFPTRRSSACRAEATTTARSASPLGVRRDRFDDRARALRGALRRIVRRTERLHDGFRQERLRSAERRRVHLRHGNDGRDVRVPPDEHDGHACARDVASASTA